MLRFCTHRLCTVAALFAVRDTAQIDISIVHTDGSYVTVDLIKLDL